MIPHFPRFKKLSIRDKNTIERFTKPFPPYSDFNFASMWSYDTKHLARISQLNKNLIIKYTDYISGNSFLTFIGDKKILKTCYSLIAYAQAENLDVTFKLIPEVTIQQLRKRSRKSTLKINEDLDNHDYIFSIENVVSLKGKSLRGKRNFSNRFLKQYPNHVLKPLFLTDKITRRDLYLLCKKWREKTSQTKEQTEIEFQAIKRLVRNHSTLNITTIGIYIKNRLRAFAIFEKVQDQYGILHFEKADTEFVGIFQYLKQIVAKELQKQGCKYLNVEQDLGIEGLRKSKQSWSPVNFLKKYSVSYQASAR